MLEPTIYALEASIQTITLLMIYSDKDLTLMTHYLNIENILCQNPLALWPSLVKIGLD
jgi:hypothetical protein